MTFQPEENLRAGDQSVQSVEGTRLSEQALQAPKEWSDLFTEAGKDSEARSSQFVTQGVLPDIQLDGPQKGAGTGAQLPDAGRTADEKYSDNGKGATGSVEKFQNSAKNREKVTTRSDGTKVTERADGSKRIDYPEGNWYEQRKDGSHVWGKKDGSTRTEFPDGSWKRKEANGVESSKSS